MTDTIFFSINT